MCTYKMCVLDSSVVDISQSNKDMFWWAGQLCTITTFNTSSLEGSSGTFWYQD